MNQTRRIKLASTLAGLKGIVDELSEAKDDIADIKDDEESAKDGLESRFSGTDRYCQMDDNVSTLDSADGNIELAYYRIIEVVAMLEKATQLLETVK